MEKDEKSNEIGSLQATVQRLTQRLDEAEAQIKKLQHGDVSFDTVRYVHLGTNVVRSRNIAPESIREEHLNLQGLSLAVDGLFKYGQVVTTASVSQTGWLPALDFAGTPVKLLTG